MKKYIAYYRVSTKYQENSGLGLEAQKNAVERFIDYQSTRSGQRQSLFAEFQEIESGTNNFRPKIHEAINLCRLLMAKGEDVILLIAKLDRLSRSIEFISTLQNGDIKFICCDIPDANNLTINIMGVIAQNEAETISRRVKDALQMKVKLNPEGWVDIHGNLRTSLGNPSNFSNEGRLKGSRIKKELSEKNQDNIRNMNYATTLRNMGMSFDSIANKMNSEGFRTVNGKNLSAMQVKRLFDRKKELN